MLYPYKIKSIKPIIEIKGLQRVCGSRIEVEMKQYKTPLLLMDIKELRNEIIEMRDKLSKRNMQIKDLKTEKTSLEQDLVMIKHSINSLSYDSDETIGRISNIVNA